MVFFKVIPRCSFLLTTITRPYQNKKVAKIGAKCCKRTLCSGPNPCLPQDKHIQKDVSKGSLKKVTSLGGGRDDPPPKIAITRPIRLQPAKVRLGFLPEEWFDFFYPKTGVTGPYIFFISFGTYLVSKEKYVLEHEYYALLSVTILWTLAAKYVGPALAKFLDKEIDEYERLWNKKRQDEILHWEDMIQHDQRLQVSSAGQLILVDAKRENVKLQIEGCYRERFVYVYEEVKNRLDYHVTVEYIQRKLMHKNLIDWVVKEVIKSYTPERADADIEMCINELASIAAKENKQSV